MVGGALFGHMPGGADLLDGLAGLHPPQEGDEHLAPQGGRRKAQYHTDDDPQHVFCNLQSLSKLDFCPPGGPAIYCITILCGFPLQKSNKFPAQEAK